MKIAVYAIAKNEEKHVGRFMRSCAGADLVLVADTGSTDDTRVQLSACGADVHRLAIRPWRFDDARNAALALVPDDVDVCISLDLDEVLAVGWRPRLESVFQPGATTRLTYPFVWNFDAAGRPLTVFNSDKIHARWGYRWRNPCHEVLAWVGEGSEVFGAVAGSPLIEHHADDGKRRDYLDLLKQATKENPEDDRAAHYYARELMYQGWYTQATEEFDRHLKLRSATWGPERAASWRYIARCWVQRSIPLASYAAAEAALLQATREDTNARESWLELAELMASRDDWAGAMWAVRRCLAITERTGHYITDMRAWDGTPEKLLVVCCKKLGDLRAQAYAGMQELARARA